MGKIELSPAAARLARERSQLMARPLGLGRDRLMEWVLSIVRVVGASFPITASAVQLNAEIDARKTQERLRRLEDPISALHPDAKEVARLMHEALTASGKLPLHLEDQSLARYQRALAILEAHGFIRGDHALGKQFAAGVSPAPTFLAYMCALYEDPRKMNRLVQQVESCAPGTWPKGAVMSDDLGLPIPVIRAVFELYEARGLGILSKEVATANYLGRA